MRKELKKTNLETCLARIDRELLNLERFVADIGKTVGLQKTRHAKKAFQMIKYATIIELKY